MVASAYGFSRLDAKTEDHYFLGFPSYWNLVALYLFCLGWAPRSNASITIVLALMVFIPIKYIYPTRTEPCAGSRSPWPSCGRLSPSR